MSEDVGGPIMIFSSIATWVVEQNKILKSFHDGWWFCWCQFVGGPYVRNIKKPFPNKQKKRDPIDHCASFACT
jgi:hypothetical protein